MTVPLSLSSVPAVLPYIQYVATGGQTVYPYPFPITQDADLVVVINGVTQPTDSGYTLSGQGNSTGGNVTLNSGSTGGDIITLFRNVTIQRLTQIGQNSGFSSAAFNAEFNNIYLILQQLQESITLSLQLPNTNSPAPTTGLTPAAYANKYLSFDASGNPTPAALTLSGAVTAALVNGLVNGQTTFEQLAGVVPTNLAYQPGDIRRYGALPDSGVTNNRAAIQNALTACAGYCPVVVQGVGAGYYGGLTTLLNIPSNTDLQFRGGAKVMWASTTALSGPVILGTACRPGLNITGNNVKISGQGSITGPTAPGVYVSQEHGIVAVGTSAAAPITNIEISGVEITGWGSDGIELKWCTGIDARSCKVHDCGYAGMHFLTCNHVKPIGNEVYNITPGTAGNAYGISFTQDQSGGNPTNSRTDANHMCIDVECAFNFIHDIPLWLGIDAHGLFDGNIHDNKVYNCWTGIQIASTPNTVGENNSISFNEVNILKYDGSATTVVATNPMGITVNGFSATVMHAGVRVVGNVINGYGNNQSPPTAFSIQASNMQGAVIADNAIRNWSGYGIYTTASDGGQISGNVFGATATTYVNDACIQVQSSNSPWHIAGNMHHIASGTAAHFGAVNNTGSAPDAMFGVNDFVSVQTAQYGGAAGSTLSNTHFTGWKQPILSANTGAAGGIGYVAGAGGTVTQLTSRTTGVTLNTPSGQITLFSVAGSATPATFTVTNNAVAAQDTVNVSQGSGTDLYQLLVTNVQAGSFRVTAFTTGGTTVEAPNINFNVVKGSAT